MERKKKLLNLLTLFLFLSVLIPIKAQAYSLLGGKLINGVGNTMETIGNTIGQIPI